MIDITEKNLPQVYNHLVTKSDIEKLSENLKDNIFETSNGISELASLTVLKQLIDSLDKKLRANIDLLDNRIILGRITIEKSTSPTLLNLEDDPAYCKLKSSLDARVEVLKNQYKLNSRYRISHPGSEFIGIVEDTGEQVTVVSKKEGTGRGIIKITIPN